MKRIIFILLAVLLFSCNEKEIIKKEKVQKLFEVEASKIVTDTTSNAVSPYFFVDIENNIFLNWSEEIDSSKVYILKYKIYNKEKSKFGNTITVSSSKGMQSHNESMSKIGKTKNGVFYAIFRVETPNSKRRFAGSIYYSFSKDNGNTWSKKIKLVNQKNALSQSFYDITLLPDGELGISWLDSRKLEKDKDGSTLYFAKTKGDLGFINEKAVAGSTCQCCRTDIFVDTKNKIHIAYRNITEGSIRDMYRIESADNGFTFSITSRMGEDNWKIDGCPHTGPSLADNSVGLAVTWFTGAEFRSGIFFKNLDNEVSIIGDKTLVSSVGSHPQMIATPNGSFHIVYEEFYKLGMKFLSNIVLQVLKKDGSVVKKNISKPNTNNHHAVINRIDDNKLIVAWVNRVNKKNRIIYTIINI